MPIINLTTLQDILGGTIGVTSELTAIAARGYGLPPRRTGEAIVFPQEIRITIVDGVPDRDLVLTTLPAGYYWKIVLFHPGDAPYRVNALVPSGAGPFNFSQLIPVSPRTCVPIDGAMEQAYLDQITNAINNAEGHGVPSGGTAGQVLAKTDGTDYNTEWVDQTGGSADVADFVFNLDGDVSSMTIHNHDMDIRTTRDDLETDADISLDSADDVWISANDEIQLSTSNGVVTVLTSGEGPNQWTFQQNGNLTLPSGTSAIASGSDGTIITDSRTVTFYADYVDATPDLNQGEAVYLPINTDTQWFSNNTYSTTTITFADATSVQTVAIYDATSQGTTAMIFQWSGPLNKTAQETYPLVITGNVTAPKEYVSIKSGANSWNFDMGGAVKFPSQTSNQRTGTGEVLEFGDPNQQSIITGSAPTPGNPTAQRLVVAGQDGYTDTTGEGGDVYLWAGRGGSVGGSGGDIKVDAGNGGGDDGYGGTVKVRGGYSTNNAGGYVLIEGGNSSNGAGGNVDISAGDNYVDMEQYGGSVTITAGSSGNAMGGGSIALSTSQAGSINLNADGKVLLNGQNGEFLNDAGVATNQIATIGDLNNISLTPGPPGADGADGAPGEQGPSGVIAVTAPITNSGTSTSANIGIDQDGFGHISNLAYAQFDTTNTTAPATPGRMAWNQTDQTMDLKLNDGVTLQIGQEMNALVANYTGSLIPEGAAVYVVGAQGQRLKVALASASAEGTSAATLGIVTQTGGIAHGSSGYVTTQGIVHDLNLPTSSFSDGDILWLSTTAGEWSRTRPQAPNHGVQIGYVINASNGAAGSIYVHTQNGYELDELHNVNVDPAASTADNEVLAFDSATSTYMNQTAAEAGLVATNSNAVIKSVNEAFSALTGATGVVAHNYSNGAIFTHSSIAANFTVNVTNLVLASGYGTSITLMLNQGGTAYIPNAFQIGGVAQTINWQGGSAPTGNANKKDVVSFSIFNASGTYTVLGQLVSFG